MPWWGWLIAGTVGAVLLFYTIAFVWTAHFSKKVFGEVTRGIRDVDLPPFVPFESAEDRVKRMTGPGPNPFGRK